MSDEVKTWAEKLREVFTHHEYDESEFASAIDEIVTEMEKA